MRRYHFSVGEGMGSVGMVGAIRASDDEEAVHRLQIVFDAMSRGVDLSLDDLEWHPETTDNDLDAIEYLNVGVNFREASLADFDEVWNEEDEVVA